ncbi:MAG: hypothetical protein OWU84_07175 [Firmicutes bacterium]|nr:hypothetical protein [Bacillota bacterium]
MISNDELLTIVVESRLSHPTVIRTMAAQRLPAERWRERPLVLVAADHPARGVVAAGADPWAMADRGELLRRLARVLMQPFVDGVLVTPDIMEELWMLQAWVRDQGGPAFLDGKLLIGSMNRAGLAGAAFESEDVVTAYTPQGLAEAHMDAGKLLLRLNLSESRAIRTIEAVVAALNELAALNLPVFLEPIAVPLTTDELVRLMGVASGLGQTSLGRWLKVPMVEEFHRVARATSYPLVLLGGAERQDQAVLLQRIARCLNEAPTVRGVLMGRSVLYPEDGSDPRRVLASIAELLRGDAIREVVEWPGL